MGGGDVGDELEGLQVAVEVALVLGHDGVGLGQQLGSPLEQQAGVAAGVLERLGHLAQVGERAAERVTVLGDDLGQAGVVGGQAVEGGAALHQHLADAVAGACQLLQGVGPPLQPHRPLVDEGAGSVGRDGAEEAAGRFQQL